MELSASTQPESEFDKTKLSALDANSFSLLIPTFFAHTTLSSLGVGLQDDENTIDGVFELIRSRAIEPPTVLAISGIIKKPIQTVKDFHTTWAAAQKVIAELPLSALPHYRQALQILADIDVMGGPPGVALWSLARHSADIIKFMDEPSLVWVPQHKADFMGGRSLQERVGSPEQMGPHVPELLVWLQDVNWPPYNGCVRQLARFPEVTVKPIQHIMMNEPTDTGWILHLLQFVEEHVPIGPLWEVLRLQMKVKADDRTDDPDIQMLSELAAQMLNTLKEWEQQLHVKCA